MSKQNLKNTVFCNIFFTVSFFASSNQIISAEELNQSIETARYLECSVEREEKTRINELTEKIKGKADAIDGYESDFLELNYDKNNEYSPIYQALNRLGYKLLAKESEDIACSFEKIRNYYNSIKAKVPKALNAMSFKFNNRLIQRLQSNLDESKELDMIGIKMDMCLIKQLIEPYSKTLTFIGAADMLKNADELSPELCKAVFTLKDSVDLDFTLKDSVDLDGPNRKAAQDNWNLSEKHYLEFIMRMINVLEGNKPLLEVDKDSKEFKRNDVETKYPIVRQALSHSKYTEFQQTSCYTEIFNSKILELASIISQNLSIFHFDIYRSVFDLKDEIDYDYLNAKINYDDWNEAQKNYKKVVDDMVETFQRKQNLFLLAQLEKNSRGSNSCELFIKRILNNIRNIFFNAKIDRIKETFEGFDKEKVDKIVHLVKIPNAIEEIEDIIGSFFNIEFRFNEEVSIRKEEDPIFNEYQAKNLPGTNLVMTTGLKLTEENELEKGNLRVLKCEQIPEEKLIWKEYASTDAFLQAKICYKLAQSFLKKKFGILITDPNNARGPSGGFSTFCAMISAITGKIIPKNTVMTGMLNPDGSIGKVGFIENKMDAADRCVFIKKVVLPEGNNADFEAWKKQNPESELEPTYVKDIDELIRAVFGKLELD